MSGAGWSCNVGTTTCTTANVLAGSGASYPPITLIVSVAGNAPISVVNLRHGIRRQRGIERGR